MNLRNILWLFLKTICCVSIVKDPKRVNTRLQIPPKSGIFSSNTVSPAPIRELAIKEGQTTCVTTIKLPTFFLGEIELYLKKP